VYVCVRVCLCVCYNGVSVCYIGGRVCYNGVSVLNCYLRDPEHCPRVHQRENGVATPNEIEDIDDSRHHDHDARPRASRAIRLRKVTRVSKKYSVSDDALNHNQDAGPGDASPILPSAQQRDA
jgi:hypothetical protein